MRPQTHINSKFKLHSFYKISHRTKEFWNSLPLSSAKVTVLIHPFRLLNIFIENILYFSHYILTQSPLAMKNLCFDCPSNRTVIAHRGHSVSSREQRGKRPQVVIKFLDVRSSVVVWKFLSARKFIIKLKKWILKTWTWIFLLKLSYQDKRFLTSRRQ